MWNRQVGRIMNRKKSVNINIIEVVTDTHNAPVTGAPLFHMVAKIYLKEDNKKQLMEKLNAIESDFGISVKLEKI